MIVINITKFWLMVINPTGYYNMYIYIIVLLSFFRGFTIHIAVMGLMFLGTYEPRVLL